MNFFQKFNIKFGNKKDKYLPESITNAIENTMFTQTDCDAFKTLAMFDLNIESPKYEGAIPEATVKFYPLK